MDKKGEGVPWYLLAFILMVIVLLVVWLGSSPKFRSLFGITETQIRNLNETGSSLFDFKRVFGIKEDDKIEDTKVFDAESYMNNLLDTNTKASLEEFLGICNDEEKYKNKFDASTYESLKKLCTSEKVSMAMRKLDTLKGQERTNLRNEFLDLLDDCSVNGAGAVLNKLIELGEPQSSVDAKKADLEKKKKECEDIKSRLQIENAECKEKEDPIEALRCDGNVYFQSGDHVGAARAYSKLVTQIKSSDNAKLEAWLLLGNAYEAYGGEAKIKAYKLYEDLSVRYYESRPASYAQLLNKLKDIFQNDKDSYIKNAGFSKILYTTKLHGGIVKTGFRLFKVYFDWNSYPRSGENYIQNRAGLIDYTMGGVSPEITFSPGKDAEVFGIANTDIFNKAQGSDGPLPASANEFSYIAENGYVFSAFSEADKKAGRTAEGVEVSFIIADLARNKLCDGSYYTNGEKFKTFVNKFLTYCGTLFDQNDIRLRFVNFRNTKSGYSNYMTFKLEDINLESLRPEEEYLYSSVFSSVFGGF